MMLGASAYFKFQSKRHAVVAAVFEVFYGSFCSACVCNARPPLATNGEQLDGGGGGGVGGGGGGGGGGGSSPL
jgi:uncharacterized membrane protein